MAAANQTVKLIDHVIEHMSLTSQRAIHGGILLTGDPGIGKAQSLTSKIKTPTGWTLMGDVKVGDALSMPDGTTALVAGVYPQGQKQIYKITFADGRTARACGEHLWNTHVMRKHHWEILNTTQIKTLIETTQRQVHIPLITQTRGELTDLPIDPYVFGCLLGDGGLTDSSLTFSTMDVEMIELLTERLMHGYTLFKEKSSTCDYRLIRNKDIPGNYDGRAAKGEFLNTYRYQLNELGLLGKNSYTKFIPDTYKTASLQQKEELIAGLVDTDGYVNKQGALSISTSSPVMARDIQEIIWSMGGMATIKERYPTYTYLDEIRNGATNYVVSIRYPAPRNLSKLTRKRDLLPENYQYADLKLRVVSIEEDGIEEAQCILVDHPDHLYITDNYVVTHNTTFVEILGALLGIKCIVIEVPHITEEHLINIPFLVVDKGQHPKSGVSREVPQEDIDNPQYKMILAQSNLYTQIVNTTPMANAAYIQHIQNSSQYIQDLYKHLGGTETEIPEILAHARQKFHVILFLDEFFRTAPIRIRNVLRDILNNRIGMHEIPASTYILYASNKNDKGLDKMPSNYQFEEIAFKAPTKDDWFGWFISKFKNNEEVQLNKQVIEHFQEILTDEDISFEDMDTKIRTSPRRWEQMLLYISTALPVSSEREAHILLTNIRSNFIHYLQVDEQGTNLISKDLSKKVLKAVVKLIKDTSNITAQASDKVEETDWREALDHQVKMQMKLGKHKKHVPIVSGPPGIGKSSRGYAIAEENNLRFVPVDISSIYADDVTGLPIPGKSDANKTDMSIKFSLPKLYHQIMKGIEAADALYIGELKQKYGTNAQEHINKYEHARWKYLILLDELNRVDQKTFNALRKVILEKNFGPKGDNSGENLVLPKEAIVIGAINPTGEGTHPFTEHFRDAVDFVHAKANWDDTVALLQSKTVKDYKDRVIPAKFNEAAMNIIQIFVNKFKTRDDKVPVNQQPYHLDIGAPVYVSSREYSQLWARLVQRLSRVIDNLPQEATPTQARHAINEAVSDIFDAVLAFPLTKANVDGQEFFATLKAWIAALPSNAFVGLLSKTAKVNSVVSAMGKYLDGDKLLDMLENQNLKNAHDASTNDQVISDVVEMLTTKVKNSDDIKHYIIDKNQKMVEPTQDELVFGSEPASLLENFVLGLVYTLHLHNYENARLMVIGKALSKSFAGILSKLKSSEAIDDDTHQESTSAIIDLRQKVLEEINKLNPQPGK